MFFATEMQKTRVLGLIAFLCLSGLIAYVYAMVLWSARRSGAKIGLLLSFYHYLLDGLALGAFSSLGFFALGTGGGNAVMILALHMIFGSLFGLLFDWAAIRDEVPVPIDSPAPRQAQASMPERRNAVVTTSEA
jgi:hypothetical protein